MAKYDLSTDLSEISFYLFSFSMHVPFIHCIKCPCQFKHLLKIQYNKALNVVEENHKNLNILNSVVKIKVYAYVYSKHIQ